MITFTTQKTRSPLFIGQVIFALFFVWKPIYEID
jgi:hypothetical protein